MGRRLLGDQSVGPDLQAAVPVARLLSAPLNQRQVDPTQTSAAAMCTAGQGILFSRWLLVHQPRTAGAHGMPKDCRVYAAHGPDIPWALNRPSLCQCTAPLHRRWRSSRMEGLRRQLHQILDIACWQVALASKHLHCSTPWPWQQPLTALQRAWGCRHHLRPSNCC